MGSTFPNYEWPRALVCSQAPLSFTEDAFSPAPAATDGEAAAAAAAPRARTLQPGASCEVFSGLRGAGLPFGVRFAAGANVGVNEQVVVSRVWEHQRRAAGKGWGAKVSATTRTSHPDAQ